MNTGITMITTIAIATTTAAGADIITAKARKASAGPC